MIRILFAGGGTGGHLRPAVTLAHEMVRRSPDTQCRFLVAGRRVEREFLEGTPHEVFALFEGWESRPAPWRADVYTSAWRRARRLRHALEPHLTVLLGGYVAAMGLAGRPRRHPCLLLESNALPGRAARFLARRCERVLLQWESARHHIPCPRRAVVTGMPMDKRLGAVAREEARRSLGLEPTRPTILVLGGSQGSLAVNRLGLEALRRLGQVAAGLQVFHLAGPDNEATVREASGALPCPVRVVPFFAEMAVAYAAADLVVARAGGMTVAELGAAGRPAILVPYPHHRDQHQLANARELESLGAALIVSEGEDAVDHLAGELGRLITDRDSLLRMEGAACATRRHDPLGRAADLVEELAQC